MKILIYIHALAGGGTERICTVLASGFVRAGHEVIVAVDNEAQENLALLDPRVRLLILGKNHTVSIIRLARLLRREKPDVSFSGIGSTNLKHALAAMLAGRLSRSILSFHGYYESEPQLLSRIAYKLTPYLTRWTGATICVSQGLLDYMVREWGADQSKTRLIYNPVFFKAPNKPKTEADLLARDALIIASGRLVDYKNFERLIRAFGKVKIFDARLIILGQGPEKNNLTQLIGDLQVEERVRLLGYVKEPWELMAQARVLALSSNSEAFGLVIVEGMANGLAIVSSECDGPIEILRNGEFGNITAQDDDEAFAEALTKALNQPGEPIPRMNRAEEFSEEVGIARYLHLFEEISQKHCRRNQKQNHLPLLQKGPLIFYTHALADGGAERVWALLASGFHQKGYHVIMVVDYELNDNRSFLDDGIELIILGGNHLLTIKRLYELIKERKPAYIFSALSISNLKSVVAATLSGRLKKTILSYHGFYETERQKLSRISYLSTPILSRISGHMIAVSDVLLNDLKFRFWIDEKKSTRIYNPVIWGEHDSPITEAELQERQPIVLASGRLVQAKGFDKLINAFALVKTEHARLIILGEGPERSRLEDQINRLGLGERISLPGYIPQPWIMYRKAKCFVLSSELESFGLVVVEALGHGLPVISTDCQGPREILSDGQFGTVLQTKTDKELAKEIDNCLTHPGNPIPRINRAREFSLELSLEAYTDLLLKMDIEDTRNEQ